MPAYGYEFYLLVVNSISHSFAALTREISSWPLEDKIHIHARACNILYLCYVYDILYYSSPVFFRADIFLKLNCKKFPLNKFLMRNVSKKPQSSFSIPWFSIPPSIAGSFHLLFTVFSLIYFFLFQNYLYRIQIVWVLFLLIGFKKDAFFSSRK